eukprot:1351030-Pleurochrysis_carterae.AAC.5
MQHTSPIDEHRFISESRCQSLDVFNSKSSSGQITRIFHKLCNKQSLNVVNSPRADRQNQAQTAARGARPCASARPAMFRMTADMKGSARVCTGLTASRRRFLRTAGSRASPCGQAAASAPARQSVHRHAMGHELRRQPNRPFHIVDKCGFALST